MRHSPRESPPSSGHREAAKTTILNCIAGITSPDEGEIHLHDKPLFSSSRGVSLPPEQRHVGLMFQESLLFPHYRVRDNILYGFKLTPPERRRIQPEHLVELLELGSLMERRPSSLSTGERQRVALARALATSPELLLLDEPLGALDIALRGRILRYLRDVHRELGTPMVYVSHSISEVLAIADRALVISGGTQLAFDEPRKVLLEPYVHSLVELGSVENLLDAQVVEQGSDYSLADARIGDAVLRVAGVPQGVGAGDTISLAISAGDIIVAVDRPSRISARNIPQRPYTGNSSGGKQRAAVRRRGSPVDGGDHPGGPGSPGASGGAGGIPGHQVQLHRGAGLARPSRRVVVLNNRNHTHLMGCPPLCPFRQQQRRP